MPSFKAVTKNHCSLPRRTTFSYENRNEVRNKKRKKNDEQTKNDENLNTSQFLYNEAMAPDHRSDLILTD